MLVAGGNSWFGPILQIHCYDDFCGIHHQEIEFLRSMDKDELDGLQVVTIHPSMSTMKNEFAMNHSRYCVCEVDGAR